MRTIRIILSFLAISCVVQAQEIQSFMDRKVTLSFSEASIGEVLKMLEEMNKGLVFVYSSSTFDMDKKISGSFIEETIRVTLESVFKNEPIEFQEKRGKIIIKPKKKTTSNARLQSSTKKVSVEANDRPSSPNTKRRRLVRPVKKAEQIQTEREVGVSEVDVFTDTLKASTAVNLKKATRAKDVPSLENVRKLRLAERAVYPFRGEIKLETVEESIAPEPTISKRDSTKARREEARTARQLARQNEEKKFRIYGASYTGYTQVGGKAGIQMGGSLVWLKNKRWGFGLAGYAVQRGIENDAVLSGDYRLGGGYGGFLAEYTLSPSKKVHLSFPLMIGGGALRYAWRNTTMPSLPEQLIEDTVVFFAAETSVNVEVNIMKYLKAGMGLGYRYTTNTTLNYQNNPNQIVNESALTGLNFGVTIKFGIF